MRNDATDPVQGKGYPDISTREFLRHLSVVMRNSARNSLSVASSGSSAGSKSIFAIVDHDPHGFNILSVYKFGSIALAHENHRLVVHEMKLLGVKNVDLGPLLNENSEANAAILPLTSHDRKKVKHLLEKGYIWTQEEWRCELQRMLFMNLKAELQAIDVDNRGGLEAYLTRKLHVERSG